LGKDVPAKKETGQIHVCEEGKKMGLQEAFSKGEKMGLVVQKEKK